MTATCGELFSDLAGTLVPNLPARPAHHRPAFFGSTYSETHDRARLNRQLTLVRDCLLDGQRRTLAQISQETGEPEASVSARLRQLRLPRFGFYDVKKNRLPNGAYEYWIANTGRQA